MTPARGHAVVRVIALVAALAAACALAGALGAGGANPDEATTKGVYAVVTAQEARGMIASDKDVVVDVRTVEEYEAEHIANARCLPVEDITKESAAGIAPDITAPVYVYCRTGVRAAEAAQKLADLGYERVYDFGGIVDWPYGTIVADDRSDEGTVENDQLPVGVKVVCGKTRALPSLGEGASPEG